jgi:DNA-directed RNA polymerase specialized sigma24 family protein
MTGRDELTALPETYGLALRLQAEGLDPDAIGRVLDIETESVGPLLELAKSKLAGITQRAGGRKRASGCPSAGT